MILPVDPEHYKDALQNARDIYDWLPERIERCAYEEAYYNTYGLLPDDHWVIERVEVVNGSCLFIHYGLGDTA